MEKKIRKPFARVRFCLSLLVIALAMPPSPAAARGEGIQATPSLSVKANVDGELVRAAKTNHNTAPIRFFHVSALSYPSGRSLLFQQWLRPTGSEDYLRTVQSAVYAGRLASQRAWERDRTSWRWDYGGLLEDRHRRLTLDGYAELRTLRLRTGDKITELYFPSDAEADVYLAHLIETDTLQYEEEPDIATEWPLAGGGLVQIYRNGNVLIAYWGDRFKVTEALEAAHGPPVYTYGVVEHLEAEL